MSTVSQAQAAKLLNVSEAVFSAQLQVAFLGLLVRSAGLMCATHREGRSVQFEISAFRIKPSIAATSSASIAGFWICSAPLQAPSIAGNPL